MMVKTTSPSVAANTDQHESSLHTLTFQGRESAELVIALSGAVGCGTRFVADSAITLLKERGYEVHHIKLSRIIQSVLDRGLIVVPQSAEDRYEKLQLGGNELRSTFNPAVLAEFAIASISSHRVLRAEQTSGTPANVKDIVPGRVAYLIDQLKHPEEIHLLRRVYGNLLYVIGVLASEEQRKRNLLNDLDEEQVVSVMTRDRRDQEEHGQQLEATLKHADFFLRNNNDNVSSIRKPLDRFLSLMHGATSITPTKDEYAMYAAHSAALRSACLSRQVGAAVTSKDGTVISTGCNDVPKSGGGLYSAECGDHDHRCYRLQGGKCFNDEEKDKLTENIRSILVDAGLEPTKAKAAAASIRATSRIKDLIEFSRSVHAEMDALISVAREGGTAVNGGKLYSTTFPCHNCARHIVAAGITHVFYIEPYEKSLALHLHSDSIASERGDVANSDSLSSKVQFLHFEGVAPRQFQNLFFAREQRKHKGKAISVSAVTAKKTLFQFLDSYKDLESKVVDDLRENKLLEFVSDSN